MMSDGQCRRVGVVAVVIVAAIDLAEYLVAVRSHNLNVFYKSLTCDPNVAACEQAIGESCCLSESQALARCV